MKIVRLLVGEIALRGYPLTMILAEKIVTAMQRGSTNTRWRDFADVYLLTSQHTVAGDVLMESIGQVAKYRSAEIGPLATLLGDLDAKGQTKWSRWRNSEQLDHRLPASLTEVLTSICSFADPLFAGIVRGRTWNPHEARWV